MELCVWAAAVAVVVLGVADNGYVMRGANGRGALSWRGDVSEAFYERVNGILGVGGF
jgi:hypothetical protein